MTHWSHYLADALVLVEKEAQEQGVSRNNARQRLAPRFAPPRPVNPVSRKAATVLAMISAATNPRWR